MRNSLIPSLLICGLLPAAAVEEPKTNSSAPVPSGNLALEPFIYNGLVTAAGSRGSGFIAENPFLFFTAAHVVHAPIGWGAPPSWLGGFNGEDLPEEGVGNVDARGYFYWNQYSNLLLQFGENGKITFGKDLALAWGLKPFTEGDTASIDFNGAKNLLKPNLSMITGYPATLDYDGSSGGAFLHSTQPDFTHYSRALGNYLEASLISTGPGNSGGPVWIQQPEGGWKVAGELVAGRPSEVGVRGMTPDVKTFLKAASPVISETKRTMKFTKSIGSTSILLVMPKPKKIPDGVTRWTRIPLNVLRFPEGFHVTSVRVNLNITTEHRGDLVVALQGPTGVIRIIHNGEDADLHDIVLDDVEASSSFSGIPANGRWQLLVQDRLAGDVAEVTRFELEISALF